MPLAGNEVAYLARDGRLYLSADGGARWLPNDWRPPNGDAAAGSGEPSWSIDLPVTDRNAPLSVAWFDDRGAELAELL